MMATACEDRCEDYKTVIQGKNVKKRENVQNTNPSLKISSTTCTMSPYWPASLVWTWPPCVHVMDARLSFYTDTVNTCWDSNRPPEETARG